MSDFASELGQHGLSDARASRDVPDGDGWDKEGSVEYHEIDATTISRDSADGGWAPEPAKGAASRAESARVEVAAASANLPDMASIDELLEEHDDSVVLIDWHDIDERSDSDRVNLADNVPNARKIPPDAERFHFISHGYPDGSGLSAHIDGTDIDLNVEQTALIITANPDWNERPVTLFACWAGAGDFAQNLANRLGVEVIAADDIIDVKGNGTYAVGDWWEPGAWRTFAPMRK